MIKTIDMYMYIFEWNY